MIKLIDGWQAAWRYHVVIAAAALAAVNYLAAHPDVAGQVSQVAAAVLPPGVMMKVNVYAPVVIVFLRLIKQPKATAAVDAAATNTAPAAPADPQKDAP